MTILCRSILLAGLVLMGLAAANAQSVDVYLTDKDAYTNVRNAPRGKVVDRLPADSIPMFSVTNPTDGWWQIEDGSYYTPDGNDVELKGSTTGYWIHHSVIGFSTRNYGGQTLHLRKAPSITAPSIYSFKEETILHPLQVADGWVKVKTSDGHVGWIEAEWLCSNAVTTCC